MPSSPFITGHYLALKCNQEAGVPSLLSEPRRDVRDRWRPGQGGFQQALPCATKNVAYGVLQAILTFRNPLGLVWAP